MQPRRKFLLSAGALATASTVGTVGASGRAKELTSEEINEEFLSGVAENGADGARQALEDLGLTPKVQEIDLADYLDSEDDQASPAWAYSDPRESDSSLVASASPTIGSDPEVWMSASMSLEDPKTTFRNSWWSPDAVGIGFEKSDWAPMGEPSVRATHDHTASYTAEDVADDALAGTVDIANHRDDGAAGEGSLPEAIAGLTGRFRLRDGGEPSSLWGSYTHTFSYTPGGAIDSISGGYGGLSVEISSGYTAWSIAHPSDPEDAL